MYGLCIYLVQRIADLERCDLGPRDNQAHELAASLPCSSHFALIISARDINECSWRPIRIHIRGSIIMTDIGSLTITVADGGWELAYNQILCISNTTDGTSSLVFTFFICPAKAKSLDLCAVLADTLAHRADPSYRHYTEIETYARTLRAVSSPKPLKMIGVIYEMAGSPLIHEVVVVSHGFHVQVNLPGFYQLSSYPSVA
ncbi:hypothetical protein BDW22DRAFT_921439 [Trametopsis cervina]|nr:hypothetical protein BDW22DRAFT_921439 [Trametopsis cervina]